MSISDYEGKRVIIKSTGQEGKILHAKHKRGISGMSVRMIIEDTAGAQHELMPHEYKLK